MSTNEAMKYDDVLYYWQNKKIYYDGTHLINVKDASTLDASVFDLQPPNIYNKGILKNLMLIFNPPSLQHSTKQE